MVAEQLLIRVLLRAKELTHLGEELQASSALSFFLKTKINKETFSNEVLNTFAQLDDYDIISAMKEWQYHKDFVLSNLCQMIIDRSLLKIKIKKNEIKASAYESHLLMLEEKYNITKVEAQYFVFGGTITNQAYQRKRQNINILFKTGKIVDIIKASDHLNLKVLSKPVTKYYICYPKEKL